MYTLGSITPPSGIDSLGGCTGCGLFWDLRNLQGTAPVSGTRKWTDLDGVLTDSATTTFTAAGAGTTYPREAVHDNENLYCCSFNVSGTNRPYFAQATNGRDFVGTTPLADTSGTLLTAFVPRAWWSPRAGGRVVGQRWSSTTAATTTIYLWGSSVSGTALASAVVSATIRGMWMRPDAGGAV